MTWGEKSGGIHCKGLCSFKKHEIVGPKGFRFCFATTYQQTLGESN